MIVPVALRACLLLKKGRSSRGSSAGACVVSPFLVCTSSYFKLSTYVQNSRNEVKGKLLGEVVTLTMCVVRSCGVSGSDALCGWGK